MSTKRTIVITDRYSNEMTVTSDGTEIEVEMNGTIDLDEVDRDRLRDFLNDS
jgi:hypothetical protein